MQLLTLHAILVAAGVSSDHVQGLFRPTMPLPVVSAPEAVPASVNFRIEVNTALKPPRLYIFDGPKSERIIESADVLSVTQGHKECPNLSIISIRGDGLQRASLITSSFSLF